MDKAYIREIFAALRAELIRFRFVFVFVFLAIIFAVLITGMLWPKSYTTRMVLHADETNIIGSLLKDKAVMTNVDRSEQASEIIYTRRILQESAVQAGLIAKDAAETQINAVVRQLRGGLKVSRERNKNYVQLSYTSSNPDRSFDILNSVVNSFIEDTAKRKRDESVGAYTFIDAQVQSYKRQLEVAEEKLKEFKSKNTDGSEESVSSRLSQLRLEIEGLKITIEETQARVVSIQEQLNTEGRYLQAKGQVVELRQRRQLLISQLEQMLLSYQESYPDVIMLRAQLAELDSTIDKIQDSSDIFGSGEKVQNPLYEELRKQMSDAEVSLQSHQRRMESLLRLQEEEFARQQRIAANQAELSELTRDYNVTKKVYEEMLQRKENARLSMTLDIEGQGVTYRIQEPATFPLTPSGMRFMHFAGIAPFLGFLLPLGLLIAYVLGDPHLRSSRTLQKQLPDDIDVIGVIPHYKTPLADRLLKKDMIMLSVAALAGLAAYLAIALYWHLAKG
jgi:polysaccharide chain length determinant protein (PEP-CTERM system associated)